MKIKNFLFALIVYFFSLNILYAIEPDIFVQSTVNRASKVLSQDLSNEVKNWSKSFFNDYSEKKLLSLIKKNQQKIN